MFAESWQSVEIVVSLALMKAQTFTRKHMKHGARMFECNNVETLPRGESASNALSGTDETKRTT